MLLVRFQLLFLFISESQDHRPEDHQLLFGALDWNDLSRSQPPPVQVIIGLVEKKQKREALFAMNKHIITLQCDNNPLYWWPGDHFNGGPSALAILNLTNQPRGGSIGGRTETGAVAIFLGKGKHKGYKNYLRIDPHGWSLEIEVTNTNQKNLMQLAKKKCQMIRIFLSASSPFRQLPIQENNNNQRRPSTTLYFGNGYIVSCSNDSTIYLLRHHQCPDPWSCKPEHANLDECQRTTNLILGML